VKKLVALLILASALICPVGRAPAQNPGPSAGQRVFEDEITDKQARWELARLYANQGQYARALEQYERLIEQNPDLAEARAEMARVLFWNGERDRARQILEDLPDQALDESARLTLAEIYIAEKNYGPAESLLRRHLKTRPDDHAARLKLADVLSWTKQYDQALAEYEKILKARPDDTQVRRKYAFVLMWAGKNEQAARQLEMTLD